MPMIPQPQPPTIEELEGWLEKIARDGADVFDSPPIRAARIYLQERKDAEVVRKLLTAVIGPELV
jgi:hypothetical protein